MKDILFGPNALQNYFSTLIGIVITVLLIPIIIKIYLHFKKRTKRLLGRHIIIEKINMFLEDIIPAKFKNYDNSYSCEKGFQFYIIPFELKGNYSDLSKYFEDLFCNHSFTETNSKKLTNEYLDKLKAYRQELFDILNIYGDCFSNRIIKEIYKIDFNVQTQKYMKRKDKSGIAILIETIEIVISVSFTIRNSFLNHGKKQYFKDIHFEI